MFRQLISFIIVFKNNSLRGFLNKYIMYKAKLLKSFLIIASFIVSTLVIGESIIEEVVTTGSYLNSQTDESNQTLTVIDRDFIDKINAQNVSDIVKNITFSSGAEIRRTHLLKVPHKELRILISEA